MLFWKMKRRARSCANTPCPASSRFWSRRCITSLTTRQGAGLNPAFAASRNCLRRGARPSASPLFRAGRPALFLPHHRRADVHHRRRHHPPHISRADLTLSRRPPVRNMLWYPDERRAAEFFDAPSDPYGTKSKRFGYPRHAIAQSRRGRPRLFRRRRQPDPGDSPSQSGRRRPGLFRRRRQCADSRDSPSPIQAKAARFTPVRTTTRRFP